MKSVALFDVDNTIYDGFSFTGVLENEVSKGILKQSVLDDCLQILQDYKNGKAEYEASVLKVLQIHALGLKGQAYKAVLVAAINFYESTTNFYAYAKPTIKLLKSSHDVVLVTAEPEYACAAIMGVMGVEYSHSTVYTVANGYFTGKLSSTLSNRHDKQDAIYAIMKSYATENSFAFGDSDGDIEMLKAVQYPVCVNATPGLYKEANKHEWFILEPTEIEAFVSNKLYS